MATQLLAVELVNPVDTKECAIKMVSAEAKQLGVHYTTMPNNGPKTNNDKFYLWEHNIGTIPYGDPPLKTFGFPNDKPEANASLTGLSLGSDRDYIVGLAVGPDPKNVVAACFVKFPPGDPLHPIFAPPVNSYITFEMATSDTVQVQLHTLRGFLPKTWGCVMRLFEGEFAPLTPSDQVAPQLKLKSDQQSNPVSFDGLSLATGYNYTVGFYTNPLDDQWTTLAASVTFTAG